MQTDAVQRAIATLEDLEGEASFAFLAGDSNGLDCTLGQGSHDPNGVHVHLLATHMAALSDVLNMDVGEIAKAGLEAHEKMEREAGAVVAQDAEYGGDH